MKGRARSRAVLKSQECLGTCRRPEVLRRVFNATRSSACGSTGENPRSRGITANTPDSSTHHPVKRFVGHRNHPGQTHRRRDVECSAWTRCSVDIRTLASRRVAHGSGDKPTAQSPADMEAAVGLPAK